MVGRVGHPAGATSATPSASIAVPLLESIYLRRLACEFPCRSAVLLEVTSEPSDGRPGTRIRPPQLRRAIAFHDQTARQILIR